MENRALSPSTPSSRGMDKYEQLAVVGEGSYGVVLKCRRRDNGQLVAIKKFLETEDDAAVRKMALREIRMLKKLRHEHLVNMIEVFRRKRRFYLVFEYLDHTLLDELESNPGGLGDDTTKKHLFQLLRGIDYCHQNSIIHRDVKPENVLISHLGVVKLCDLGFARALAAPGEPYTEYVATRWYRAPELLVADHKYGPEVDIWAIGCLFAEMLTGDPLFPGDSDIDQLALIIKTVGKLAPRHQQVVAKLAGGAALGAHRPASGTLPGSGFAKALLAACVRTEPRARPSAASLLRHKYFLAEGFMERFIAELRHKIGKNIETPVAPKQGSAVRPEKKPRNQWTLNIIPDPNSSSVEESMTGEALIDCKYTPSSASNMEIMKVREKKHQHICPNCPHCTECLTKEPKAKVDHGVVEPLPPPSKTQQNRNLGKALNDAFQTFSVPVRYPKTPYIKKVNTRLIMDEDLLKGRAGSKKLDKNFPNDFTLPNVPGASNSPVKKVKKPTNTFKGYDSWEGARGTETTDCKTPNLPYM